MAHVDTTAHLKAGAEPRKPDKSGLDYDPVTRKWVDREHAPRRRGPRRRPARLAQVFDVRFAPPGRRIPATVCSHATLLDLPGLDQVGHQVHLALRQVRASWQVG